MNPSEPPVQPPVPLPDPDNPPAGERRRLVEYLGLALSLPERGARAAAALVGGASWVLSTHLIPAALRGTNTYRFTAGMFQTFLIRDVAGMQTVPAEHALQEQFLTRKLVGSGLEAAGLLTLHFSPVWVFAIASDAARGGQVFLQRLTDALREHGLIAPDQHPGSVEQVLLALQDVGDRGATAFDTPPLSLAEVSQLRSDLTQATGRLAANATELLPRFEDLWQRIERVSLEQHMTVEQVLGVLAINVGRAAQTGGKAASVVGRSSLALLDESVLRQYRETLDTLQQEGGLAYVQRQMEPFLLGARSHFDWGRETLTQRWLRRLSERRSPKSPWK